MVAGVIPRAGLGHAFALALRSKATRSADIDSERNDVVTREMLQKLQKNRFIVFTA
jgi:hypothetical protein